MMPDAVLLATRETCRICGSPDLRPVIDLGDQHIASIFVTDDVSPHLLRTYPLEVVRCSGEGCCGLVQLKHTLSPDVLYSDYGYRSGTNEMMRANLKNISTAIEGMIDLKAGDVIVDIGCNDGTLLESYKTPGLVKVGFDPANNVARLAVEKGLRVVNTFFSFEEFDALRLARRARVVTTIAMLYDLETPWKFFDDVVSILSEDGVWVIELSYLPFMLQKGSFDTICHEHLEYYALRQLEWMLDRKGLLVHGIEFNDINGGSFRLYVRRRGFGPAPEPAAEALRLTRERERALGLETDEPFDAFCRSAQETRRWLRETLAELRSLGKTVYVYGASTKGNTILQYCGIGHDLIAKAADRNPEKWGRHTLGTNIPIVSEEQARAERPDYFLVLPWHFLEGFIQREAEFLRRGGKFIVPLPEVRVIGIEDTR